MEEEGRDQGTRSKGVYSYTVIGGGGGSPCGPTGYPAHNGPHYPVNGYPTPAPPPGAYPGYGGYHYQQPSYNHSPPPPHHVPAPAYAYPESYGVHGAGGYGGYGKHQPQHVDSYMYRREETDMYQGYGAHNNHGYSKHHFGIRRGISDAKV